MSEIRLPIDPTDGHCCEDMATANERNLVWLYRAAPYSLSYGIVYVDGGAFQAAVTMPLGYCPWCGADITAIEADTE